MTKCDYDLKVVNSDKDEHELENTGSPYRSELIEHSNLIVHDFLNYKTNEFGEHIDPDNNFYNKIINECEYYTEEQSNNINMEGAFSLIHFNSRSLYKNFEDIKECLSKINKFSVIAVSETWMRTRLVKWNWRDMSSLLRIGLIKKVGVSHYMWITT